MTRDGGMSRKDYLMDNTKLKILAVGAHPDDLEILCAGTLAKYAKLGYTVIMAHLLNGDKGHYEIEAQELARIREKEALEAGKVIGAEVIGVGIPDGTLFSDLATREKVIDLIRDAKPDVIITHDPGDYMSDHTTTSQLVCDGSFFCTAPLFKTQREAHNKVAPVFFMDTIAGMGFSPTEYVDISETFAQKKEMLSRHKSQLEWLKNQGNVDILSLVETVARFRGLQCGAEFAECFRQYDVWPRKAPRRLLP